MRWLWLYGLRWAKSRVWQQAKKETFKQAAASAAASAQSDRRQTLEKHACQLAVLCETKRLFDAVADTLGSQRRIEGDRFCTCAGTLAGGRVVVARPTDESLEAEAFVSAIVDGHRPQLALSASEGSSLCEELPPGELVVAQRLLKSNQSLRLDGTALPMKGMRTGDIRCLSEPSGNTIAQPHTQPIVADQWCWPSAVACKQAELPLMAVSVVVTPANRSKEVAALDRQESTAGQAGVLVGMLWKKRSGLGDLWREKEAGWEACGRLAKLVELLARSTASDQPQRSGA